jgi:hypothetical protein
VLPVLSLVLPLTACRVVSDSLPRKRLALVLRALVTDLGDYGRHRGNGRGRAHPWQFRYADARGLVLR